MFVFFFLFFLHGALKLEGFQRIRDFNAREVIMLVVQIKYKMEVDTCNELFYKKKNQFWRGPLDGLCLGPRLRSVKIGKLQFIFKIITKRKCIHFQAILWSVPSAAFFLLHPSSSYWMYKKKLSILMEHDKTYFLDILNRTIDQVSQATSRMWLWCLLEMMMIPAAVRVSCVLLKLLRPEEKLRFLDLSIGYVLLIISHDIIKIWIINLAREKGSMSDDHLPGFISQGMLNILCIARASCSLAARTTQIFLWSALGNLWINRVHLVS